MEGSAHYNQDGTIVFKENYKYKSFSFVFLLIQLRFDTSQTSSPVRFLFVLDGKTNFLQRSPKTWRQYENKKTLNTYWVREPDSQTLNRAAIS